jgi:cell division protein FtsQ
MTKPERDLHQQRLKADLSRARKRKIKREDGADIAMQASGLTRSARTTRQHAPRRSGASTRERLVLNQIKDQMDSLPSLQGKISSMLGLGGGDEKTEAGLRRTRRESGSHKNETLFEATRRVETQRITGSEQGYLPPKNRRVYDSRSEVTPPVMVRGGMDGMAFGRVANSRLQKSRSPRRRFDVPLKVTGAEMRLPAIPLINLGWRAVSLFMVLMMSASLLLMWKAPVFQVTTVEGVGIKRLTVADLNAVLGTFGKSIFSLDPNALRQTLKVAFPELSKISVRVNLPAKVTVVVTERQPIITWTQDGVETWVDGEGISFPPRGVSEAALVKVEGYGTPPSETPAAPTDEQSGTAAGILSMLASDRPAIRLSPELVAAILALGAKMPADTVLVYDSQHGLGWNDPNGWDVFFGNEDQDMDMKLSVYQALVERLKSEGIQPALISVEYVHAPYYRMER